MGLNNINLIINSNFISLTKKWKKICILITLNEIIIKFFQVLCGGHNFICS